MKSLKELRRIASQAGNTRGCADPPCEWFLGPAGMYVFAKDRTCKGGQALDMVCEPRGGGSQMIDHYIEHITTFDPKTVLALLTRLENAERMDVCPLSGNKLGKIHRLYSCRHWDEHSGLCRAYDQRPTMCRNFPYEGKCVICGKKSESMLANEAASRIVDKVRDTMPTQEDSHARESRRSESRGTASEAARA